MDNKKTIKNCQKNLKRFKEILADLKEQLKSIEDKDYVTSSLKRISLRAQITYIKKLIKKNDKKITFLNNKED